MNNKTAEYQSTGAAGAKKAGDVFLGYYCSECGDGGSVRVDYSLPFYEVVKRAHEHHVVGEMNSLCAAAQISIHPELAQAEIASAALVDAKLAEYLEELESLCADTAVAVGSDNIDARISRAEQDVVQYVLAQIKAAESR